ncbi:flagellar assembly peptidoglycan hydrolase FlgJ [Rosenbergiella collisarenosi]|uniref:flagellar assembly peptidoglycan hydrolase FlgJ n=1 Tax=Rosenbergiella collisarenosi TaxID=1544695 RepID=UPI001BD9D051|nr:flagellar assembly peptidoglycan hydrolase FlgJ [Rosenbergiella collisarenosi]MBT0721138.1 flagellar assembly peptidoglycan hydrolase FlgJ [Rosenbergiella collisarenosi]
MTVTTGWDVNELNALRGAAQKNASQNSAQVAQQVEGIFLQMMLKSMRQSLPGDDLLGSDQQRLFTSLYDQQITQLAPNSHLGLAALIEKQMQPVIPPASDVGQRALPIDTDRQFFQRIVQWVDRKVDSATQLAHPMQQFIQRLLPHVKKVSRQTGIPEKLILAQAALESGWGQRQITTECGQPSHNLFGIKAGGHWQGPTTATLTTEYRQGRAEKTTEPFRVYRSWQEALQDYGALLANNPRYQAVTSARSAEQGAYALQHAGYATDPDYAHKLVGIIRQLNQTLPSPPSSTLRHLSDLF